MRAADREATIEPDGVRGAEVESAPLHADQPTGIDRCRWILELGHARRRDDDGRVDHHAGGDAAADAEVAQVRPVRGPVGQGDRGVDRIASRQPSGWYVGERRGQRHGRGDRGHPAAVEQVGPVHDVEAGAPVGADRGRARRPARDGKLVHADGHEGRGVPQGREVRPGTREREEVLVPGAGGIAGLGDRQEERTAAACAGEEGGDPAAVGGVEEDARIGHERTAVPGGRAEERLVRDLDGIGARAVRDPRRLVHHLDDVGRAHRDPGVRGLKARPGGAARDRLVGKAVPRGPDNPGPAGGRRGERVSCRRGERVSCRRGERDGCRRDRDPGRRRRCRRHPAGPARRDGARREAGGPRRARAPVPPQPGRGGDGRRRARDEGPPGEIAHDHPARGTEVRVMGRQDRVRRARRRRADDRARGDDGERHREPECADDGEGVRPARRRATWHADLPTSDGPDHTTRAAAAGMGRWSGSTPLTGGEAPVPARAPGRRGRRVPRSAPGSSGWSSGRAGGPGRRARPT